MQLHYTPPGFEHINRYYDVPNDRYAAKLLPGQFFLSRDEAIVTVLGTGVAACVHDRTHGLGGMTHVLEPYAATGAQASPAEDAMVDLVKALLDAGAQRRHLEAKVFGGARILSDACEIGARSIEFVRRFLSQADIPLVEEDLGGRYPRKVDFLPRDGRVRIKHLREVRNDTIWARDRSFLGAFGQRQPAR